MKKSKFCDFFIVFDYICLGINGCNCYEKKNHSAAHRLEEQAGS